MNHKSKQEDIMARAESLLLQPQIEKAKMYYEALQRARPTTKDDLKNYIKVFLGIDVPDRRICPEHDSPLNYLWHSFNCDFANPRPVNADCVVWANRGGGKTDLAAVETLLDCVFKPNCQVRILAGSEEQAGRMYQYLTGFLRKGYERLLSEPIRKTGCRFSNGSAVDVLTQSQASVRGQHIQKLRCDEVELFNNDVFNAAKFTTQSTDSIIAGMETISTIHKPYGLMQKLVSSAAKTNTPVFKWCVWETIEKCTDRDCSQCLLWGDCAGRAKQAAGYLKIDDCITQMRRSSRAGWEAEMLCLKPNLENVVFDQFDAAIHVRPVDYDPNLPLYRSLDFGFTNPFVCLWIQVDSEGVVRVIDEYVRSRATIDVHAAELKARIPGSTKLTAGGGESRVIATFCDPAGAGTNDVTGTSAVRELRSLGINVRYRRSGIAEGIESIRRAIRDGTGKSRFVISPKCARLIEALVCYHYPDAPMQKELPLKDGVYDHPIDALRYFFINYEHAARTEHRVY
jgi:Terminase RNaseH-like domain